MRKRRVPDKSKNSTAEHNMRCAIMITEEERTNLQRLFDSIKKMNEPITGITVPEWYEKRKAKDRIEIRILDSYPCYEAYLNFTIENTGDDPVHIDEIALEDYDEAALEIEMTNLIACMWISPGETANGQLAIRTLRGAKQNWRYTFQAKINASCQPRRRPLTISFWKYEFRAALNRIDKLHIPKEKLECYLDQITIESDVFEFTGAQVQKFKQALGKLKASGSGMEVKLQAQLLGLWLNYVAGYAEGYKLNGMTAYEIIQGSETALANHQTGQYKYWKDLCNNFNKLG